MKKTSKKILSLSIMSSILLLNGCSSHEVISNTDNHLYNENFGLMHNAEVDAHLHKEILAQNNPTEIEIPQIEDPTWTTELVLDHDAVTAENYVQAPPVITYKYMDDPNFYDEATWKSNGN